MRTTLSKHRHVPELADFFAQYPEAVLMILVVVALILAYAVYKYGFKENK